MERHISYPTVALLAEKYPKTAASLFAVYNDLSLVQTWSDLEVVEVPSCSRGALRGRRPNSDAADTVNVAVPCSMNEVFSLVWIKDAFRDLDEPPHIYLAICSEDSSLVYYKISGGFVKPSL